MHLHTVVYESLSTRSESSPVRHQGACSENDVTLMTQLPSQHRFSLSYLAHKQCEVIEGTDNTRREQEEEPAEHEENVHLSTRRQTSETWTRTDNLQVRRKRCMTNIVTLWRQQVPSAVGADKIPV